jgi:hypothetical protein
MRKFKRFRLHSLRFRSLLILASVLTLLAAFAPRAKADLIAYWNFEGPPPMGFPVDNTSNSPGVIIGLPLTTDYPVNELSSEAGIDLNIAPGDVEPNLVGLGLSHSGEAGERFFQAALPSFGGTVFYDVRTVSFAINALGNGFTSADVRYSLNGGGFVSLGAQVVPTAGSLILTFTFAPHTTDNADVVIRIVLSGGQSNGNNVQNIIDNVQINGFIIPEPATMAGGLLGVLGLCWFQRKRLIRSVCLRRT